MKLRYYPDVDMLYIELTPGPSADSEEVMPDVVFDFDAERHIMGIEIEHARKHVDSATLEAAQVPLAL